MSFTHQVIRNAFLIVVLAWGSVLITSTAGAAGLPAAELRPEKIQRHGQYGTAEIVCGRFVVPSGTTRLEKAHAFIAGRRNDFRLNQPARELELLSEKTDDLGLTHLRFQQVYNGLKVWSCQTIVHFEDEQTIYLVGGQTIPTPTFDTQPSVSEAEAATTAIGALKSEYPDRALETQSELIVYPLDGDPRLARLLTVTSPDNGGFRWRVFVDAQNGAILFDYNDIHFDGPDVGSGPDVLGVIQTFPIYEESGVYRMTDVTRTGTINTYQDYYNSGPISTDPDGDKVWDDNVGQKAEVSGHYNVGLTYDYFLNTFGRDSYDGAGHDIIVNIHDPYYTNNAYWNGEGVNFADGDGTNYLPFSGSLDVVAHELSHAVTDYTADLIYAFQWGALNESYSDFFGAMVDRDDWLLGEDIRLSAPGFIRSMEDPTLRGHPKHMNDYRNYDISYDNGGVHINSGIPNHAGYEACIRITRDKAEQIWYRALSTYLTPTSGFYFWAGMIIQSAIDIHGGGIEVAFVEQALADVGLGTIYALPQTVELGAILGGADAETLWVYNPGPGSHSVTVVPPAFPGVTISHILGSDPASIPAGGSSGFEVLLDAGSFTECEVGTSRDTISFGLDGGHYIKLPAAASVGYATADMISTTAITSCMNAEVFNTTKIVDFYRDGVGDQLYDGSLLVGLMDQDPVVYRDVFRVQRFSPVDLIQSDPSGDHFRLSSEDARIQGMVNYTYDSSDPANCEFIVAEYTLYNPCDTPLTVLTGMYCDFDIGNSMTNLADYDELSRLVYLTNDVDTCACGLALLSGTARNLRAINNPILVWDGFTDDIVYGQMNNTSNVDGPTLDDWSVMVTFGEDQLGPNDTLFFQVAMLYSGTGSAGLDGILQKARAWVGGCDCTDFGDLNLDGGINPIDVVIIVNYVYKNQDARQQIPTCPKENGDWNCDDGVNPVDVVGYVNFVYKNQGAVCNPCE